MDIQAASPLLPRDCWIHVFQYLDILALRNCAVVCKAWRQAIERQWKALRQSIGAVESTEQAPAVGPTGQLQAGDLTVTWGKEAFGPSYELVVNPSGRTLVKWQGEAFKGCWLRNGWCITRLAKRLYAWDLSAPDSKHRQASQLGSDALVTLNERNVEVWYLPTGKLRMFDGCFSNLCVTQVFDRDLLITGDQKGIVALRDPTGRKLKQFHFKEGITNLQVKDFFLYVTTPSCEDKYDLLSPFLMNQSRRGQYSP